MSFQWGLIATFLYIEIAVVFLLLLPFISAQRWNKLFKSSFLRGLGQQVHIYFYVILAFLVLCLFDAIREMRKYDVTHDGKAKEQQHQHLEQELRNSMVLFRAQRNFYITGFSLFLIFVIRRLMTLLAAQATLAATSEAAMRQATSASKAAEELMSQKDKSASDENVKEAEEKISNLEKELADAKKERSQAVKDLEAFKSQSEGVAREYDRLAEEHSKLVKKLAVLEGEGGSDKKDD
ncbi:B-cell receptor-associated protein 31-like [Daphnia pulicaria]|uniref:B-cell receptor-associated protein 31-like n=1 Tax=Daphnia pulicaria TaxID=35523 RepID=UPI001EEB3648|nr:B-cell receptor-associated protein 31-like [Daphnia pulicaria]